MRRAPPRVVASEMKSQLQTWPRCAAFVGGPVETPRRTALRLVGGTRGPRDLARCTCLFPDTISKVIHCRGRRAAAKPSSAAAPAVNNFVECSGACEEFALGQQWPGAQSAEAGTVFFF